jgi:hypothetical protein
MNEKNIKFAKNLVKGKIAETIFAQMFRETKEFTVLEFGYEKIVPELIQQGYQEDNAMIETLKTAPDFAVIDQKTKEVRLIEVKYLRDLNTETVLKYAKRMSQSWNPSYLFIASLNNFYLDEINKIISNDGKINTLDHPQITEEIKSQYLKILKDFEANN